MNFNEIKTGMIIDIKDNTVCETVSFALFVKTIGISNSIFNKKYNFTRRAYAQFKKLTTTAKAQIRFNLACADAGNDGNASCTSSRAD